MKLFIWCRKHYRLLCINAICLLLFLILTILRGHLVDIQYSQQEAKRWSADGTRYHQISTFIRNDSMLQADKINEVRGGIQNKLKDASFTQDSVNGRLWIDSYMAQMDSAIMKESDLGSTTVDNVHVVGVGGDFFYFHPLDMMSGSVFNNSDISLDRIVIDQNTAWALYGATDIAGKTVTIGNRQFVIAGVYKPSDDKYEKMARGEDSFVFIAYDTLMQMSTTSGITCYEAVIPEPVSNFALITVKTAFGEDENETLIDSISTLNFSDKDYVDNTARFSNLSLIKKLWNMPKQLMHVNGVAYPYWENAIKAVELKAEWCLVFQTLFLIIPILTMVITLYFYIKREYKGFKKLIRRKFSDLLEFLNAKSRARMIKKEEKRNRDEQSELVELSADDQNKSIEMNVEETQEVDKKAKETKVQKRKNKKARYVK